jgi:small subunit ribosomal protein S20
VANHKSAEKRARQSKKRHQRNLINKHILKTNLKKALTAIEQAKTKEEALKALALAQKALGKAASKNTIPKKRASRKTSRIAQKIEKKFAEAQTA